MAMIVGLLAHSSEFEGEFSIAPMGIDAARGREKLRLGRRWIGCKVFVESSGGINPGV